MWNKKDSKILKQWQKKPDFSAITLVPITSGQKVILKPGFCEIVMRHGIFDIHFQPHLEQIQCLKLDIAWR